MEGGKEPQIPKREMQLPKRANHPFTHKLSLAGQNPQALADLQKGDITVCDI